MGQRDRGYAGDGSPSTRWGFRQTDGAREGRWPGGSGQAPAGMQRIDTEPPISANSEREIAILMSQADVIKDQLQTLYERISAIQAGDDPAVASSGYAAKVSPAVGKVAAIVNSQDCINCGICASVCPEGAITVDEATEIDAGRCTGCGACMYECPNEVIRMIVPLEAKQYQGI